MSRFQFEGATRFNERKESHMSQATQADLAIMQGVVADDGLRTVDQLVSEFEAGPAAIAMTFSGMTLEQLRARPDPGRWSSLEVLCHLADCEQFFADRLKRTIATERPLLLVAQGRLYPDPLFYQDRNMDEEIELIGVTRKQMARILRWLPDEAWQRTAVHSELGLLTLRQLVLHANNHLARHLQFVDVKRRMLGLEPLSR